jgi:hypothetical protein
MFSLSRSGGIKDLDGKEGNVRRLDSRSIRAWEMKKMHLWKEGM